MEFIYKRQLIYCLLYKDRIKKFQGTNMIKTTFGYFLALGLMQLHFNVDSTVNDIKFKDQFEKSIQIGTNVKLFFCK